MPIFVGKIELAMKEKLQYPLLVAFFLLLVTACEKRGKGTVKTDGQLSDSTTLQIEKIGETDTTQAFRMLDSLYEKGELAAHTYYTRAHIYHEDSTFRRNFKNTME
mgnify:CR=1 FL=1